MFYRGVNPGIRRVHFRIVRAIFPESSGSHMSRNRVSAHDSIHIETKVAMNIINVLSP